MTKVRSMPEALDELVVDGTHLALCGFAITRNAIAAACALVAAGRRDLVISQVVAGMETDLVVAAGCVRRLAYSGGSLDRFGNLFAVNRAIAEGRLEVEEHSTLALTMRMQAGALGLPYVGVKTMLGSELLGPMLECGVAAIVPDPFTGAESLALAPLRPEVAIVHVDVADEDGNAIVTGPLWALRETVYAARVTVVTAERVVARGALDPDHVRIPAAIVHAVVEAPGGAAPTALFGHHDYDAAFLHGYAAAAREGDDAALAVVAARLATRRVA